MWSDRHYLRLWELAYRGQTPFNLPEEEILNLLKVSTGDSWVVRNWSDVSEWIAATALSVLLKDLIATYNQGIKHNVSMPFNALSSTQLFDSMGKEKPKA